MSFNTEGPSADGEWLWPPQHADRFQEENNMSAIKVVAIVLIAAGILALVYRGFSYTKETHEAKIGSLELSVKDKETFTIPVWAGVGAIVVGGLLLLVPKKI